jgi:isoleucyl-tRNA synthetase
VKKVKCNFKILGKKFGPLMKSVAAAVQEMSQEQVAQLEKNGSFTFNLNGTEAVIDTTEVEIFSEYIPGWVVANEGTITVALDITLTEALKREGIARELKKRIQDIRKLIGLEITDRISVKISSNVQTDDAVKEYSQWIREQVLANSIELVSGFSEGEEVTFDEYVFNVLVTKE